MKKTIDKKKSHYIFKRIRENEFVFKVITALHKLLSIKLFHMIRVRLVASFMIPVSFIILLGVVSFSKASDGISNSYENSTSQALNMAGNYISFGLESVQATGNQYSNEDSIKKYLIGFFDSDVVEKKTKLSEIQNGFVTKKTTDRFMSDLFIISDKYDPISTVSGIRNNFYSEFFDTELGKNLFENKLKQFWIGSNTYLDEKLDTEPNQYAMRLVRLIPGTDAILIIDVKMEAVQEILYNLKFDKTGLLRIVTADGKEIQPTAEIANTMVTDAITNPIFTTEGFYKEAFESETNEGHKLVKYKNEQYLFVYSKIGETGAMICGLVPKTTILRQADSIKNITIIIVLISTFIAASIACIISAGIDKVIKNIISKLREAAKGDLTIEFNIKRSDEFMILINEIQHTFTNMKNLIQQVKDFSSEVSASSKNVTETSEYFLVSAEGISVAMNEIETGINQQARDAEECLSQMDNLSNRIVIVTESTKEISIIADNTKQKIMQGTISTDELNIQTKETARIVTEIINQIQNLEQKSTSIGKIINVINDIANQTNLLSLNASIEAARAGEKGRGFSVVASEIRTLADQSKESVNNINSIIEGIQKDTRSAVNIAKQAAYVIGMQEDVVNKTTESYKNINESVENLVGYLKHISENVDNIEETRVSTLEAIESMSAVLEEIAASSNNINQSADEQLSSVELLNRSAGKLNDNAGVLVEVVEKFKV